MVGDPGIEPGVRLREGVTVPCHTLRPVAHLAPKYPDTKGASICKCGSFCICWAIEYFCEKETGLVLNVLLG